MKGLILGILLFVITQQATMAQKLHLNFGGGLNAAAFQIENLATYLAPGLNFKTDLGYELNPRVSAEWSSQVKFSKVDGVYSWETLMTIGLRYELQDAPYFIRGFIGRSPTVFYRGESPQFTRVTKASRVQFDGPVVGFSLGKKFQTATGSRWFIESSVSYQRLEDETGIQNDGDIAVEVFDRKARNIIHIVSLYAMIGIQVF